MATWRTATRPILRVLLGLALTLALTVPATAEVQLRFMSWYFGEDPAGPALKTLFAEFEKRNPGIKVIPETVTSAERVPKFTAAMEAGRGPDIYMDTPPNGPNLIARGYCASLEPLLRAEKEDIKARFTKGDLDSFLDDRGELHFLPYSTGPMGLVYNARAFQDAGLDPNRPPRTWEELLEYAKKLTHDGKYGIGLFGKGDNSSVWRLWYWWMTNGAEVLTPDGKKSAINSPAFIEGIDFWADLYRKHKVAPPSVPANSFGENNQLFAQGVVAMVQSGVWQFGVTEKINPAMKGQIRVAPMPVRKVPVAAGGGTDSLCITRTSTHAREAWELLKFLSSEEAGVTVWKIHGKFPANVKAMQRPELRSDPIVQAFQPMIQVARVPFKSLKYVEIINALGTMQQEVLTGARPTAAAVRAASDRIDAILRD
ncbi:MAG TPA: sugar ABC transporter substrate-binding protein [Methylomirabilota bacterium]|nr:sugar ABC transporter substrate-binding protein [Methylomirabilota bacterium]